jgi:hypothetical protein
VGFVVDKVAWGQVSPSTSVSPAIPPNSPSSQSPGVDPSGPSLDSTPPLYKLKKKIGSSNILFHLQFYFYDIWRKNDISMYVVSIVWKAIHVGEFGSLAHALSRKMFQMRKLKRGNAAARNSIIRRSL